MDNGDTGLIWLIGAGAEEGAPDGVRRRQADEELPVRLRSGKLSLSPTHMATSQDSYMHTHVPLLVAPPHAFPFHYKLQQQHGFH